MTELHVMQGRLLPPLDGRIQAFPPDGWELELRRVRDAGVSGVEWIYEVPGEERNPLRDDAGVASLRAACAEHDVAVESLVADWFMDRPLLGDPEERIEKLVWLAGRAAAAGIRRIVLPFVDASSLSELDDTAALAGILAAAAERVEVELHLETDLPPAPFAALLDRVDHPRVLANYDTGNSAALGYDPGEELEAYGHRLGSVHVKDRLRGGGTVPLGQGDADLPRVFGLLRARGWSRPLVLQVAREAEGDEVAKTARDAQHVRALWERAA
jgi:L-ribulose-5-phosphate 3-epimerase